ncbi:OmpP1/FadL family transporter [Ghiorsea bivora]|uniref:OmpP1/FadL family transporter n=1 Tax=Ghiorsea bivora TaxID=1485545 RepID=UPI0005716788|nr:outer membrane protein transport protein [Ghiorsea bivora]
MKLGLKVLGVCACVLMNMQSVSAAALAHDDLTAVGAGAANAIVAGADDISAALYNPAGLAWQEGVQALVGSQSNSRGISGGAAGSGDGNMRDLGAFAISWLPEGGSWGVSGSIATPYIAQTNWNNQFTQAIGRTDIQFQRYSLDTFYRVNNTLGIAAGLDIYDTGISLASNASSFAASGWSNVGGHIATRWQFMPFWMLGVTYRQGTDVSVSNGVGDTFAMTLPDELSIAVAHDLLDDEIRIELAVKRSTWSSLQDLTVENNGIILQSLPTNLKDTTDTSLGLTWFWRERTQLRFGYSYLQGANDLAAYQPAIADLTGHKFTAGFGGKTSGMHLDVSASYAIYPKTTVTGVNADSYKDSLLTWMFTLSKKF